MQITIESKKSCTVIHRNIFPNSERSIQCRRQGKDFPLMFWKQEKGLPLMFCIQKTRFPLMFWYRKTVFPFMFWLQKNIEASAPGNNGKAALNLVHQKKSSAATKKKLIEVFFKYICTLPRPPQPKISVLENSHEYKKWSAHRVQRPCVFGFSSTSNFFSKVLERSCCTTQLLRILFGENKIPGGGAIS